jgi:hypothetical protein
MRAWIVPLALALPACGSDAADAPRESDHARFVFLAVLEGLYEEHFPPALAKPLVAATETEWFVTKCPLCEPVRFAFEIYSARPGYRMGSLGAGETPTEIDAGFRSPDRAARHRALQALVERHVGRKLARSAMGEADRAAFKAWAEKGRKEGMDRKSEGFGDYCPACEGVNGKK